MTAKDLEALGDLMRRIVRGMRRRMRAQLAEFELTGPQSWVLAYLLEAPGSRPMSELADATGQTPATMTGIVDRLEAAGLVRRVGDPSDRRVVRAQLTASGRRLATEVRRRHRDHLRGLLGTLAPERQAQLRAILDDLAGQLEGETDGAFPEATRPHGGNSE